jgi:hypothetical protein
MSTAAYIAVGWITVLGGIGLYATRIVVRGRHLARQVPDEDKPWI